MKTLLPILLGVTLALASAAGSTQDNEKDVLKLSIERKSLRDALNDWAQQTGYQLIAEIRGDYVAPEVEGRLTAQEALDRLLKGTPLTYQWMSERLVAVREKSQVVPAALSAPGKKQTAIRVAQLSGDEPERVRLAADDQPVAQNDQGSRNERRARDAESDTAGLEEIVVTAQRRLQRLQDVPISITAVTAEEIDRRGLVNSEDYLRGVPGTNQVDGANGQSIVIRGIETTTLNQNFGSGATTATYFGETPTTNTGGLGQGTNVDLKLVDVERVEVLRGPQGTGFGNSSMGGAVRTIPVAPKADRAEARVAAAYSSTTGSGGSSNYNAQAAGNLPLIQDKLAIRAVGYRYQDSGFYRNRAGSDAAFQAAAAAPFGATTFAANNDEVGESEVTGGRMAALFQANDKLRFTLSYLTQKSETDGMPVANSGTYEQAMLQVAPNHVVRGQAEGVADSDIDIANATVEYDFGWANLLATYSRVTSGSTLAQPYQLYAGDFPESFYANSKHRENVSEIRLATQLDGTWDFLAGLYFEDLDDRVLFDYLWYGTPATNIFGDGTYLDRRTLKQKAAFGEVSWEFAPGLTLTGGVRAYDYDRSVRTDANGFFNPLDPDSFVTTRNDGDASGSNFRGTLSYKPSDSALFYAGWSQGFRLGKPQPGLPQCDTNADGIVDGTNITVESTRSVDSDELDNYEIGAKLALLDRRVTIDAAIFRMDWSGIPVFVTAGSMATGCGFTYFANAGNARSEGVELQAKFQITAPLRIDFGGSWIDAKLTEDVPVQGFSSGDRLPGSPEVNANLGLQYEFAIGEHAAFVRTDAIYVDAFYSDLLQSDNLKSDEYVKFDASARLQVRNLAVDLFVRNLTNEDAFTFRGAQAGIGELFGYRLRPRTIGLQLAYTF